MIYPIRYCIAFAQSRILSWSLPSLYKSISIIRTNNEDKSVHGELGQTLFFISKSYYLSI